MIYLLITLLTIPVYLGVGTVYARSQSQRCYEAAAKRWGNAAVYRASARLVREAYRGRLAVHVLVWPVVWPANVITRIVTAPVGDLDTAYQCWLLTQDQIKLGRKELER